MLIRVHDESFVLFFYNSFILLDKKPLLLVTAFLTGVLMMVMYMSQKIIKTSPGVLL